MAKDLGFAKVWHGAYYMHGAMNVKLVRGNLSRTSLTEEDNTSSSLGDDVSMELTFDDGELHGRSKDQPSSQRKPEETQESQDKPRWGRRGLTQSPGSKKTVENRAKGSPKDSRWYDVPTHHTIKHGTSMPGREPGIERSKGK
jgi:hypothetical protein